MSLLPHVLQIVTITALAFTSGLSFCLSTWVIPNILLPGTPPRVMVQQFSSTIDRGQRYLQPVSRILAALLLSNVYLTYTSSDSALTECWKHWAVCLVILVPIAPYEVLAIFPINDQIVQIGAELDGRANEVQERKMRDLLMTWQVMNFGRIVPPLVASLIALRSIVGA